MSKNFLLYPARVAFHYVVAVVGGMTIGGLLEFTIGRFYSNSVVEPFVPCIALIAFFLGIASYRIDQAHLAGWAWTIGLIWFLTGIRELTHGWDPRWAHTKTAWDYARSQLFPYHYSCGDTECLYQLFYAVPFIASAAYSAGGFAKKHFAPEKPESNLQGSTAPGSDSNNAVGRQSTEANNTEPSQPTSID